MSREREKLCQCGMAIGMPGPPQVKMVRNGVKDAESTFVHDLPGVTGMVLAVICPACYTISHWMTDVEKMRDLVAGCDVIPPVGGGKPS